MTAFGSQASASGSDAESGAPHYKSDAEEVQRLLSLRSLRLLALGGDFAADSHDLAGRPFAQRRPEALQIRLCVRSRFGVTAAFHVSNPTRT
jgi:hypothetical protein